ncbi:MAG: sulfatase-like hydrolase/transferase, partial [Akkermansiaceae bacterium]|nr:sulfatase-like hydrolase/transferase [Akkermansiaceae bacterium]
MLILADDLGYRDLGCQGHPAIRTPVLDKLAADGVRLTDFHVGVSVCTPSRMALLTGAYPVRVGWERGVVGYPMGMRDGMSPDALTIAEIFKAEGYATGISGKWHIGDLPETRPHSQGFDWTYYIPSSNNQTDLIR